MSFRYLEKKSLITTANAKYCHEKISKASCITCQFYNNKGNVKIIFKKILIFLYNRKFYGKITS